MKVYSMTSKTGTDFEVYTYAGTKPPRHFEFIIDDGTANNYGIVTLDVMQIAELADSMSEALEESSSSSSRCGCTEEVGCDEWSDVAALKAYDDDGRGLE